MLVDLPGVCEPSIGAIQGKQHHSCRAAQAAHLQVRDGQGRLCVLQLEHCRPAWCVSLAGIEGWSPHASALDLCERAKVPHSRGQRRCSCR